MQRATEGPTPTSFTKLSRELHEQIGKIARHRVARDLLESLRNQLRQHPDRLSGDADRTRHSLAIIDAIVDANADAAESAARAHIASIIKALR